MKKKAILIYIIEAALLLLSAFFAFAVIGYRTTALCLIAVAVVIAVFFEISKLSNKKTRAVLRTILIVILAVGLVIFSVAEVYIIKDARTDKDPQADYLLVLGAGVNGTVPSLSLYNRLTAARDYLTEYPDSYVIVSGGQGPGEDITEALCMRDWLAENGVAPERIIMEEKATSTQENLEFAQKIISERGDDPEGRLAIVSSEYHLCRAKLMAAKLGIDPVGVAALTTKPVLRINYFIREAFGVAYFWAFLR